MELNTDCLIKILLFSNKEDFVSISCINKNTRKIITENTNLIMNAFYKKYDLVKIEELTILGQSCAYSDLVFWNEPQKFLAHSHTYLTPNSFYSESKILYVNDNILVWSIDNLYYGGVFRFVHVNLDMKQYTFFDEKYNSFGEYIFFLRIKNSDYFITYNNIQDSLDLFNVTKNKYKNLTFKVSNSDPTTNEMLINEKYFAEVYFKENDLYIYIK